MRTFYEQSTPHGRLRVWFSTRDGGVSAAPYDSLNLGDHVGDEPLRVAVNRARWRDTLACPTAYLTQVHGNETVRLTGQTTDGTVADGAWTSDSGHACTVMVADCLPVLIHAPQPNGFKVAALHAGWRGLSGHGMAGGGIVQRWLSDHLTEPERTEVWLGPCIGPQAFEVGAEVLSAFEATLPDAGRWFMPVGAHAVKFKADLAGLARAVLAQHGITQVHGNDGSPGWCTYTQRSRFFSHRRDATGAASTGRMAASIAMWPA